MIEPAGYRILVKPDPIEEVSKGGIHIVVTERERVMEKAAQIYGTLVAVGPTAWKEQGTPWAKVGDRVAYSRYGGKFIKDPETGEEFVLLNDEDITAIVSGEKDD